MKRQSGENFLQQRWGYTKSRRSETCSRIFSAWQMALIPWAKCFVKKEKKKKKIDAIRKIDFPGSNFVENTRNKWSLFKFWWVKQFAFLGVIVSRGKYLCICNTRIIREASPLILGRAYEGRVVKAACNLAILSSHRQPNRVVSWRGLTSFVLVINLYVRVFCSLFFVLGNRSLRVSLFRWTSQELWSLRRHQVGFLEAGWAKKTSMENILV